MERANELFGRLKKDGLVALERLLAEEEPESPFLDYKCAATSENDLGLAKSDRKNLSKAISGFSNTEGGLLIWGVNARPQKSSQGEFAQKEPIKNAPAFRSLIEGAISGESIPAIQSSQVLLILEGSGPAGYVIVLIPRSSIGPIRSVREEQYYFRSGSSFGVIPHGVLAGMFGQAPQPEITPNYIALSTGRGARSNSMTINFGIGVANLGAVLAEKVFLSCWIAAEDRAVRNFSVLPKLESFYDLRRGSFPGFSIVARDGVELAPGSMDQLCNLLINVPEDPKSDIVASFTLGARNCPPLRFSISFDLERLRNLRSELIDRSISTSEVWSINPPPPTPWEGDPSR